ncbi:hypothetical protein AB0K48_45730 [Nonomuraea sp. NPDC055795]
MSSKVSDVTVMACQGTTVSLRLVSADDQPAAIEYENFAIMLLEEAASCFSERESPFSQEVSFEDTMDEEWQRRFARGFITSVRVSDETEGEFPTAMLHIEVSHPAWLEHVRVGDTWESYAYEDLYDLDDCPPIRPGESGPASDDPSEAFLYLPRAAWGDLLKTGPELLEIPAYSPSAYTTGDPVHDVKEVPADWIGRAVRVTTELGDEDGSFVPPHTLARLDAHGRGVSVGARIRSIARLVPNGRRRGGRLTHAKGLNHLKAEPVGARQNGRQVELSFRMPPGRRGLALYSASHVLALLAQGWDEGDQESDLALALSADAERLGINDPWDLLERIADTYLAGYTITYEPGIDLDGLPPHQARAMLAAQWPTARLTVTMTDERWATLPQDDEWPEPVGTRVITD